MLLEAAYNGRLEVVKKMLEKGEDINQRNRYGQTPLYLAVLNGKEEVVEYLLEEGADYNIARDNGDTPLMCAVKHQNCDVLEKLLDHMKEVPDKFSMACNLCLDGSDERELLISFMERITEDKPSQRNKVMLDIIKDRY
jgi:ankyrin repeat protein